VDTDWVTEEHVEVVKSLLPQIKGPKAKRLVRECVYGLTVLLTHKQYVKVNKVFAEDPDVPLTEQDLDNLQTLVVKGVSHNGVVPQLNALEVGRALQQVQHVLERARVVLPTDDLYGLEWVFDLAADYHDGANAEAVRDLEKLVRAGLGLKHRLYYQFPINEEPA
jgi:hypothetical protein